MSWLPRISMGLTLAQLSERLRVRSAVDQCSRSSRGEWKTCWVSRWDAGVSSPYRWKVPLQQARIDNSPPQAAVVRRTHLAGQLPRVSF